jgi:copper oxidase (laccase) domain-containing protein
LEQDHQFGHLAQEAPDAVVTLNAGLAVDALFGDPLPQLFGRDRTVLIAVAA